MTCDEVSTQVGWMLYNDGVEITAQRCAVPRGVRLGLFKSRFCHPELIAVLQTFFRELAER